MSRTNRGFHTSLSIQDCADVYERAVKKRPLRLKMIPLETFTPTSDPFDTGDSWDYSVGVKWQAVSLQLSCKALDDSTYVSLDRVGPMRGKAAKGLWNHVSGVFEQKDPQIEFEDRGEGSRIPW